MTGLRFENEKGAGAAGGLGWALMTFAGGKMLSGIDFMLDVTHFDALISDVDFIFTGEGKIDFQSVSGKVISGIGRRARAAGKTVIAVGGCVEPDAVAALKQTGVTAVESACTAPCDLNEAMKHAPERLRQAAARAAEMIKIGILTKKEEEKNEYNDT
ncbi:hypothetical protein SDC9_200332 [bioreactor metagenome]|uniref:Glycerate 3-kinase n=1 Tax=bioreactor metagenome TaxID=1076179 RepID=A0A645INI9_9ZZZZ